MFFVIAVASENSYQLLWQHIFVNIAKEPKPPLPLLPITKYASTFLIPPPKPAADVHISLLASYLKKSLVEIDDKSLFPQPINPKLLIENIR